MRQIIGLLVRCGVKARGARVYTYATRRSSSTYPAPLDGAPRFEVRLALPEGLSFVERIGFRYCVDKSLRASAAAVYWRTVDTINRQRLWMADRLEELHQTNAELSFSSTRALAAAELSARETPLHPHYSLLAAYRFYSHLRALQRSGFRPFHRGSHAIPSPETLFTELGVRDWFVAEAPDGVEEPKRYCTTKHSRTLPTFTLAVTGRRTVGKREV